MVAFQAPDFQYTPFFCTGADAADLSAIDPQPLSANEARAAEDADLARVQLDARLRELHSRPAPRGHKCGRGDTLHIRRDHEGGGGTDDALIRMSCGRSDCPHCWRRRLCRTYRRAARCLLDSGDANRPRVGPLYVAESDWLCWETFDKAIRRRHGGDCGRLRIRRLDGTMLVVCAQPFRGARPVSPSEACDLAIAAIGRLHVARHAYRQLGDWTDGQPSAWKKIGAYEAHLDYAAVEEQLAAIGIKSRQFRSPDLIGLLWRCTTPTEERAAESLVAGCPSLASCRDQSINGQSRTPTPTAAPPFDDDLLAEDLGRRDRPQEMLDQLADDLGRRGPEYYRTFGAA